MNNEMFNIIFSFVVGAGIVAIARPLCKGDECKVTKAPPVKDWDNAVYRIGADCHEYTVKTVQCPVGTDAARVVEPFARRQSDLRD
jgi:hypothetical protein